MLPIDPDHACRRIAARIGSGTQYRTARMSPTLSYGRHRGPAGPRPRHAAILIALMDGPDGQMSIPLTLRPQRLKHHGGQICFPGGGIENGESIEAAAIREFEEELGHRPEVLEFLGCLSPVNVYASAHCVHPVVVRIADPRSGGPQSGSLASPSQWQPDPNEVERVILVELDALMQHGPPVSRGICRPVLERETRQKVSEVCFRAPAFEIDGNRIWGATAVLMDELAQMLLP